MIDINVIIVIEELLHCVGHLFYICIGYWLTYINLNIWDKVFKSRLSKFCGRQPLKNLLSPLLNNLSYLFVLAGISDKKIEAK